MLDKMAKAEKDEVYKPELDLAGKMLIEDAEFIEDIDEVPQVTALTTQEQFDAEVAKVELQIVQQYVYGASVDQLAKRYRQYTPAEINRLILDNLSTKNYDEDLALGAGIFGFQDDLRALSDFLEEAPKGSAIKLHGIKIRSETRDKMLKFLQSTKLLPTLTSVGEILDRTNQSPSSMEAEETTRKLKVEFETQSNPQDRLKYIELLEAKNGQ